MTKLATPPLDPAFRHPIAHRGLHDAARGIVENSAAAFSAAIAHGYGIECDLRPADGGKPIVFHDETIDRLIAECGPVSALTPADLSVLRYRTGGEAIVTFAALLALVAGRVPLLVEVKSEWDPPDAAFLAGIAQLAASYTGPIGLMSFDPDVVARLAVLAPTVPRGLISGSYNSTSGEPWWPGRLTAARRAHLRDLAGLDDVGASFIAYEASALPTPATTAATRARGLPLFAWTVRTAADGAHATSHADAAIFEGFLP